MRSKRRDITEFLNDGSLAGLCAAAQRITGVPIALRAVGGDVVAGDAQSHSPEHDEFSAILRINSGPIGALVVPQRSNTANAATEDVRRFLTLLASVVGEICDRDVELHEHLDELGALYQLSSMLVGVTDLDQILNDGLEMAVAVLGVDAGAIRLLTDHRSKLKLAASFGLSDEYTDRTEVVLAEDASDTQALAGGVVLFEDILREGKPIHPEAMEAEGLLSMISAGLMKRDELLFTDRSEAGHAYVVFDHGFEKRRASALDWLEQAGLETLGRFGRFEYDNSDACVIKARALARRLIERATRG